MDESIVTVWPLMCSLGAGAAQQDGGGAGERAAPTAWDWCR